MKKFKDKIIPIGLFVSLFALFALISYWTPLAGDDWGYAVNGVKHNAFVLTAEFYFTWSGRIFSELWGFLIAPNKWLWNILNPLLFTGIAWLMYILTNPKTKKITTILLIFFLMLSVKNLVRMETYTWIMGTTYVVPLFLYFLYLYCIKIILMDCNQNKLLFLACILLNLIIPLWMENIATTLIFSNTLIIIYSFFNDRSQLKRFIVFLSISLIGLAILRLSPGAAARLLSDHPTWSQLTFIEQIQLNWQNFLQFTFLDNKYLIFTLSLTLLATMWSHRFNFKGPKWFFIPLSIIFSLGVFQSMSSTIYNKISSDFLLYFFDLSIPGTELFISVFYTIYVGATLFLLTTFLTENLQSFSIFLVLVGGSSTLVMLLSPIFGARSSLYYIYIFILFIALLYNALDIPNQINSLLGILLLAFCLAWGNFYYQKYSLVNRRYHARLERIEWIKANPKETEAWIERMPYMSVHSADIEDTDVYHQEVFKEYFGLDPKLKLIFYWPN